MKNRTTRIKMSHIPVVRHPRTLFHDRASQRRTFVLLIILAIVPDRCVSGDDLANRDPPAKKMPVIGQWWTIASNPDLGQWTSDAQEPVDFGIWQAVDGTWQLWSCIRKTKHPGRTRIFHRWEGR